MTISAGPRSGLFAATLLAAAACSPEASPAAEANEQNAAVRTNSAPKAAEAVPARAAPVARADARGGRHGQRRCGWLSNPTPANWWLTDRDGQWILGTQGGEQVPGMEEMPDMSSAGWVGTNGDYGYGCACITIAHDPATRRVTRISDAEPKPLGQCRADRSLPPPE